MRPPVRNEWSFVKLIPLVIAQLLDDITTDRGSFFFRPLREHPLWISNTLTVHAAIAEPALSSILMPLNFTDYEKRGKRDGENVFRRRFSELHDGVSCFELTP